jgi:hypothetical protein
MVYLGAEAITAVGGGGGGGGCRHHKPTIRMWLSVSKEKLRWLRD